MTHPILDLFQPPSPEQHLSAAKKLEGACRVAAERLREAKVSLREAALAMSAGDLRIADLDRARASVALALDSAEFEAERAHHEVP